ncbi:MAG: radical SAM protein, partial [Nanoarchaeota archaeon]
IAVRGEGEITIIEILNCLEKKGDLTKIKGIICKNKKNETILTTEREPIKDIESIPLPDFEGMEFEKFLKHSHCNDSWTNQVFDFPRPYPLLGSRGCPFNCTFCWHSERYRARSIKNIIEELELMIKKYDINIITIYDDCFSADKKRLYDFCKHIKKLSITLSKNIKWTCQLLVNTVDEEMLATMKDAGCDSISYGFESFSLTVLKSMRKPITPERIDKALKATLKAKISIQGNFIFGDVAETKETSKETLRYWESIPEAQQISLGFVQPYPGSILYDYCLKKGIIRDKIDYIQNQMSPDTRLNMTEKMTNEEIGELNKKLLDTFRKHFKFVTPTSFHKTDKNIYEFDFKCPFCKQTTHYQNCAIETPFIYGFHLICRQCHMRSVLVGPIKKLAYQHYTKTRKLRNLYTKLKKVFKQKRI